MNIIDAHTHIGTHKDFVNKSQSIDAAAEALAKEMRASGVSHAIVIAGLAEKYVCDGESATNTHLREFAKKYPQMSMVAAIDVKEEGDIDIAFIEQAFQEKTIVGVKFYPGYQAFYPADIRCEPIYKLCEQYNVPVIFHSGDTLASKGYIKYSHPLAIDDVAVAYPNLKISSRTSATRGCGMSQNCCIGTKMSMRIFPDYS